MVVEFRLYPIHIVFHLSRTHSPFSRWRTILQWCFSRSRKHRSWTERPKFVREDHLACHPTLVDLILDALANRGEPSLFDHDPKIEITLRRLRKARNIVVTNSSNFVSSSDNSSLLTNTSYFVEYSSTNNFAEQMENNDRTMKELATPDVVYQPWCIQYPQLEPSQTYELKSGLIHSLPKFHGLTGEIPTSI
ncbi:hypothetical protein CR513_16940, partial [Mucuna pruriens]